MRGRFVTGSVILSERNTVVEFCNNCYRIILEILNKVSINEVLMKLNLVKLHFKKS